MTSVISSPPSAPAVRAKQPAESVPGPVLVVLVFQNLFNAYSPYLTTAINILVAIAVLVRHGGRLRRPEPVVITTAYFVLAWLLLVAAYRGSADLQVLLKYFRVALAVTVFILIFAAGRISASVVTKAVNFSLAFHVLLILAQIAVPELSRLSAPIFGFEREITILEEYAMRKLGASSSYDTASLLSVTALLFFQMQYAKGKGTRFLFLTAAAFIATLMSSRAGIALSLLIVGVICLKALRGVDLKRRVLAITGTVLLAAFAGLLVLPLVLHTLGVSELGPDDAGLIFAATDYGTTGTWDALTDEHLQPLDQPLVGLIFGYAIDPNSIGRFTDIGYVKLVYHVGIVGTAAVLLAHGYMLLATRKFLRQAAGDGDRELICRLLFWLVAISIIFNYKSLELHSRGIGDFIYMLFLFLAHRAPPLRRRVQSQTGCTP